MRTVKSAEDRKNEILDVAEQLMAEMIREGNETGLFDSEYPEMQLLMII